MSGDKGQEAAFAREDYDFQSRGTRCAAWLYKPAVEKAASRMREVTLIHLPVGHFEIYVGDWFEKAVKIQGDFLARHLGS